MGGARHRTRGSPARAGVRRRGRPPAGDVRGAALGPRRGGGVHVRLLHDKRRTGILIVPGQSAARMRDCLRRTGRRGSPAGPSTGRRATRPGRGPGPGGAFGTLPLPGRPSGGRGVVVRLPGGLPSLWSTRSTTLRRLSADHGREDPTRGDGTAEEPKPLAAQSTAEEGRRTPGGRALLDRGDADEQALAPVSRLPLRQLAELGQGALLREAVDDPVLRATTGPRRPSGRPRGRGPSGSCPAVSTDGPSSRPAPPPASAVPPPPVWPGRAAGAASSTCPPTAAHRCPATAPSSGSC